MWGLSEIINLVLGGGLVATLVAFITLRQTIRKAEAEAERAAAEADTVRIDNTEKATRILMDNIVKPLKEEFNETKKELARNTREMARLRKALDSANKCPYHDECPVLERMREYEENGSEAEYDRDARNEVFRHGQHGERNRNKTNARESADVGCQPDTESGQPEATASRSGLYGQAGTGEREDNKKAIDRERTGTTVG